MPTSYEIRKTRVGLRLTQNKASALVKVSPSIWKQWEGGLKRMPDSIYEYFITICSR